MKHDTRFAALEDMPLSALLFDMDGTVVDTETPWYLEWVEECARRGIASPSGRQWTALVVEHGNDAPVAWFRIQTAKLSRHDLRTVNGRARERFSLSPLPGALSLLQNALDCQVPVGIVTDSGWNWVNGCLPKSILERVHLICTGAKKSSGEDNAFNGYHYALRFMGAEPSRAIAVEDTPHGVEAAHAANIAHRFYVPTLVTGEMSPAVPHVRLKSLVGTTVESLTARLCVVPSMLR